MPFKRIYEKIDLQVLGYGTGSYAEVCVNPSRKDLDAYVDASSAISPIPLTDEELRTLQGKALVDRLRPDPEAEKEFSRTRSIVFGKVCLDGTTWDLSSPGGYAKFLEEGDAQVTILMHQEFLFRRNERLKNAVASFRRPNGTVADAGQVGPAVGAAAGPGGGSAGG